MPGTAVQSPAQQGKDFMSEERQLDLLKTKRQKGTIAPGPSELQIQCAVARLLKIGLSSGWLCNHFPAGELRTQKTGERLKAMGLKPGWADNVLIGPDGRHYWLEIKGKKGKLSEAQVIFRAEMVKRGVPHAVVHSVDAALVILKEWGAVSDRVRVSR